MKTDPDKTYYLRPKDRYECMYFMGFTPEGLLKLTFQEHKAGRYAGGEALDEILSLFPATLKFDEV